MPSPHHQIIRVLVAEDNDGDVALLRHALAGHPVKLSHVKTLADLFAKGPSWAPDVILLDVRLDHDTDFIVGIRKVVQSFATTPVIAYTGLDDEEFALRGMRAGLTDYIIKGTDSGESLVRRLREAMARQDAPQRSIVTGDIESLITTTVATALQNLVGDKTGVPEQLDAETSQDLEIAAGVRGVRRWWPVLATLGTIVVALVGFGWRAKTQLDDMASDAEVVEKMQVHQTQGHGVDKQKHERLEQRVGDLEKSRERTDLFLQINYEQFDYVQRHLKWQADGKKKKKPQPSKRLEDLQRKALFPEGESPRTPAPN